MQGLPGDHPTLGQVSAESQCPDRGHWLVGYSPGPTGAEAWNSHIGNGKEKPWKLFSPKSIKNSISSEQTILEPQGHDQTAGWSRSGCGHHLWMSPVLGT